MRFSMSAIIYWQNPCKLPMCFRCIKAWCLLFSRRFSRTCLEWISFNFFVCFIFNVSLGSAPKRKKQQYLMLYQTWNRTSVYFKLALSASYVIFMMWKTLPRRHRGDFVQNPVVEYPRQMIPHWRNEKTLSNMDGSSGNIRGGCRRPISFFS